MKIHEYQAKSLLSHYGAPIPNGSHVMTLKEAVRAWRACDSGRVVLKAQIHAGGRGKGGGIKVASTEPEVRAAAAAILGMRLVTHQTGAEGRIVRSLLVEEAIEIERELYAAITLDRAAGVPVIMVSREGGMDIEEVAASNPSAILKFRLHPFLGLQPYLARRLAYELGLGRDGDIKKIAAGVKIFHAMAKLFTEKDASLVEINPLVVTKDGRVLAADAKVNFDESALFRHPDIEELRDEEEEEDSEIEARMADLSYVKLDGAIGCMVNGAGLAMATMDILKHFGGAPANFLDIGGRAKRDRVTRAFRIILSDPSVKAVFVNIFGGIVRCDEVAHGIIEAKREIEMRVPVTIRLTGTNEEEGRRLLEAEGFGTAVDLNEAAAKAVKSVTLGSGAR